MMASESKEVDPRISEEAAKETVAEVKDGAEEHDGPVSEDNETAAAALKAKKKSKKGKMKNALTSSMAEEVLQMNPALKNEIAGSSEKPVDALKKLDVSQLLTGMTINGKNQKDMSSYKFWQTQPVPRFDDKPDAFEDGEIKVIDPEKVPKEPRALIEGFEWVTMDLTDDAELSEVHELLNGHYVEDTAAQFRLNYSLSFFNWALKAPGWLKDWHVGVRAAKSRKLVAFISAIPVQLRIRGKVLNSSEVNFLCIHKRLRSKRLAPILIEEITRRCYLIGVFQAIYTGGVILPKPVSSCRYFHRSLDWIKLYECGFANLPPKSTKSRQVTRNHVPSNTTLPGFREMEKKDLPAVHDLLSRYLKRFTMAPEYSQRDVSHWLFDEAKNPADKTVFGFVVEDPHTHKITDFSTFYLLESIVIDNKKHNNVRAAYLFYYATEAAFAQDERGLRERLNALMLDVLVVAKKVRLLLPIAYHD